MWCNDRGMHWVSFSSQASHCKIRSVRLENPIQVHHFVIAISAQVSHSIATACWRCKIAEANVHSTPVCTGNPGVGYCAGHRAVETLFINLQLRHQGHSYKRFHNFEFSNELQILHARANELQDLCVLAYMLTERPRYTQQAGTQPPSHVT